MYSRVCVRACLRLTAPLRREGRGGAGYSEDRLPSLLSFLPPSLLQPLGRATSRLVPSQLVRRQWQLLQQTWYCAGCTRRSPGVMAREREGEGFN